MNVVSSHQFQNPCRSIFQRKLKEKDLFFEFEISRLRLTQSEEVDEQQDQETMFHDFRVCLNSDAETDQNIPNKPLFYSENC